MGDVKTHVIRRLQDDFGLAPPARVPIENLSNFYNEYIDALSAFSDSILVRAMDDLRLTEEFWPSIARVHAACKKHIPVVPVESANWGEEAKEKPTPEQVANVKRMAKLFRESVQPMRVANGDKSPFAGTDRVSMMENEKRWRAAERG